ncbi:MAG TPA: universal stress protein [Solirubrobacteraceae bacterium]|nr:universal stress protein [Solirubrobacteraceae bacterium]
MSGIVVGVDGSEGARAALAFALAEARLRGTGVRAVAAWHLPATVSPSGVPALDPGLPDKLQLEAREALERALEAAGDRAAGVAIEPVVRLGAPAQVLLEEAQDADLLVVGSRGLGGFRGLLLGSVGQQCAHHTPCPLVIVPHDREL